MTIFTVLKSFLIKNYLIGANFSVYLKVECISEKYYLRAINVWNVFKMNTVG